jgi:hypothetical protein
MTVRLLVFRDRLVRIGPSRFARISHFIQSLALADAELICEGAKYNEHEFLRPWVPRL